MSLCPHTSVYLYLSPLSPFLVTVQVFFCFCFCFPCDVSASCSLQLTLLLPVTLLPLSSSSQRSKRIRPPQKCPKVPSKETLKGCASSPRMSLRAWNHKSGLEKFPKIKVSTKGSHCGKYQLFKRCWHVQSRQEIYFSNEMERCPAHITAWALIYATKWGDAVICARGENTRSHLVMGSSSVRWHSPSPSGFIYHPVGVIHEHYTWLSSFLLVSLDLWPSKSRIIGWHWMSFISRVQGAKPWRQNMLENDWKQKECMTWCREGAAVSAARLPLVYFYNRRLLGQLCTLVPSTCVYTNGQVM